MSHKPYKQFDKSTPEYWAHRAAYKAEKYAHKAAKYAHKAANAAVVAAGQAALVGGAGLRDGGVDPTRGGVDPTRGGVDPLPIASEGAVEVPDEAAAEAAHTTVFYRSQGILPSADRPVKPKRKQHVLTVLKRTELTPHLVELRLGGDGFAGFTPNEFTDAYVKLLLPTTQSGLVPPYQLDALPSHLRPVKRTYSVRRVNDNSIDINVVVHGSVGVGGTWARSVAVGDEVALLGPGGKYRPDPQLSHVFIGDNAAISAISHSVEQLLADNPAARAEVVIFVAHESEQLEIPAGENVRTQWLVVPNYPVSDTHMADAFADLDLPDLGSGGVQVFAHGERGNIKALRRLLRQRQQPRNQLSISGYWAKGRNEDRFQAEKHEPIGQIEED